LCTVDKPTRVTKSSATLIDRFYTNNLDAEITTRIVTCDISDHFG